MQEQHDTQNCLFGITPTHPEWTLAISIALMHYQRLEDKPVQAELRIPEPSQELLQGLKAAGITVHRETLNVLAAKESLGAGTYYKPPKRLTHHTIYACLPAPSIMVLPEHGHLIWRQDLTQS